MTRPETIPLEIAPVSTDQISSLADLILPIQQAEFGIFITLNDQPDLRDVDGFYRAKGCGEFWVATRKADGAVVGSIALLDIGSGDGALRKMFVHKDHRGGQAPLAGLLLHTLFSHARQNGLKRIWLGTTDKFLAAHRFYEKNGFEQVSAADLPATFPRMAVDTRFYRSTF